MNVLGISWDKKKKLSMQNGTYTKTLEPKIRVFQLRRIDLKVRG